METPPESFLAVCIVDEGCFETLGRGHRDNTFDAPGQASSEDGATGGDLAIFIGEGMLDGVEG